LQLNADFGSLSLTILSLNSRPWLILTVPVLFCRYRRDLEVFRRDTTDRQSVALHESLLQLYMGRLRFRLFAWLGIRVPPMADWILRPFNVARLRIDDAKDIH
jgi:hypothetical protein